MDDPFWMPCAEAIARAGSLEVMRPYLLDDVIPARHAFCKWVGDYKETTRSSRLIPPEWWAHDPKAEPGRILFRDIPQINIDGTDYGADLYAFGVEFGRDAADALWPAQPKPKPLPAPSPKRAIKKVGAGKAAPKRKPRRRKPGPAPLPIQDTIEEIFEPVVREKGVFPTLNNAALSVRSELETRLKPEEDQSELPHVRTIERWIKEIWPHWIPPKSPKGRATKKKTKTARQGS